MKQTWLTKTRILGIILLIIAILAISLKQKGGTGIAIAGIILLIAPTKHGQKMFELFIENFSKWKTIITTALYDALYYLLLSGALYFFYWRLQVKTAPLQLQTALRPGGIAQAELVAQDAASVQGVAMFLVIGMILLLAFALLIYSLSRGMIWTAIANQRFTKKFFKKFLGLNSLWWLIWLPIFLLINIALRYNTNVRDATVMLIFIAAYFTAILHTLYMKKGLVGFSIGNALGWGISKVHKLIVPYTLAFVIYVIVYQAFKLAQGTPFIQPVTMLFVVLFMAWLRTYLYEIIKTFE